MLIAAFRLLKGLALVALGIGALKLLLLARSLEGPPLSFPHRTASRLVCNRCCASSHFLISFSA